MGDEDPVATDESDKADERSDEDKQTADEDSRTGTDRLSGSDVDPADKHISEPLETVEATVVAGLTAPLDELVVNTPATDVVAEQIDRAGGSAESDPVVATEPVVTGATSTGETVDRLPAEADGNVEDLVATRPTGTNHGGADGIDLDGTLATVAAADGSETAERIDRPVSNGDPGIEPTESSDEDEAGGTATGVTADGTVAADGSVAAESTVATAASAAMADRRLSSLPDAEPTDPSPDSNASTEVPEAAGVAPTGQPATPGNPETETDTATGDPSTFPDATDLVDRTDTQPAADREETVDQRPGLGNDRPASGLSPVASYRAPVSTALRSSATAVESSNPAPELVELQTTGLAERLRPAFTAVRRGVNGLDELRLRIQDDNAGPIKVDISTVDNRVRVVLSAGNDDLMRHLGQERNRLADELRRAGFDQASIDIESGDRGQRHGRYDEETAGRPGTGTGAAGPRRSGAAGTGSIEQASSRRNRRLAGLDLDL
ncbi:MAG: flagellar hook-length control protein FliK [Acidimicrobiia bacterium]|nr:flagellar hook-length control protein FliK [Acidimicrobiia bacterium]